MIMLVNLNVTRLMWIMKSWEKKKILAANENNQETVNLSKKWKSKNLLRFVFRHTYIHKHMKKVRMPKSYNNVYI